MPADPGVPTGPNIQENLGRMAPGRTYQDLLTSGHEERLYDHFYTSQPAFVGLDGKKTPIGKPAVYASLSLSTDGQWLVVTRVKRPYSYVVPANLFPRDVELWDRSGKMVKQLADVPMGDMIPPNGVFAGPRSFTWHALEPATLYWAEALDKGDIRNKVPHRDRVMVHQGAVHRPAVRAAQDGVALRRNPVHREELGAPQRKRSRDAHAPDVGLRQRRRRARRGSCSRKIATKIRARRCSGRARRWSCTSAIRSI